jgi:hypothetical protein
MIRKSPVIQWNRQKAILFHESIPLSPQNQEKQQISKFN